MTPLRIDLKGVILDGSLNRFKDPLLVLKSEPGPVSRGPHPGSQSQNQSATRRHVVQIHIRDRAFELEQLYLDTFSSSQTITSPTQRRTVSCSRSECSLTFHYQKDESANQQRSLMVKFQVPRDLEAVIDQLKICGVEVEVNHTESQGSSGFVLQPQEQVLEIPAPVVSAHQQSLYHGIPPLLVAQPSQELSRTRPANRTLKRIDQPVEETTLSQSGEHTHHAPKRRKRPLRGNEPPVPQSIEKGTKSARQSKKSSITSRSKGYQPARQAATTKLLENGNNFTMGLASVGSMAALAQPASTSVESTDLNDDAEMSSQSTMVMPPSVKSDDRLIQELMITHDVISEATKVWNGLKERGQTGTKEMEDLQEIQKMWISLGEELVQHLHGRLVATVGELREAQRQATGQ